MSNVSQRVGFDTERARAATTFTGSYLAIGSALTQNPVVILFDNQTDVAVPLSFNQTSTWMTLAPGEAYLLDLRANHGMASNYSMDIGTQFYTNASVGTTGSMRISNIYAR